MGTLNTQTPHPLKNKRSIISNTMKCKRSLDNYCFGNSDGFANLGFGNEGREGFCSNGRPEDGVAFEFTSICTLRASAEVIGNPRDASNSHRIPRAFLLGHHLHI